MPGEKCKNYEKIELSHHISPTRYTNVDPALRHAVEQLPVGDWL
jgi:hypothetical protein